MASRKVKSIRAEMIRQDKVLKQELNKEMHVVTFALAALLTASVQGWKKKPKFTPENRITPNLITGIVNVTGKKDIVNIFHWVDKGTGKFGPKKSAYPIFPKKPGGTLFFRTGYSPRTRPIAKANVGSGKASGPRVAAKGVIHPGIEAREFTSTLEDVLKPDFKRRMENALRRASRKIK
jgi:hypothetical protein